MQKLHHRTSIPLVDVYTNIMRVSVYNLNYQIYLYYNWKRQLQVLKYNFITKLLVLKLFINNDIYIYIHIYIVTLDSVTEILIFNILYYVY